MKKTNIEWKKVDVAINRIVKMLPPNRFNNIYGPKRGGFIPAVMLSHKLGLPIITDARSINPKTLFVDDIVDSGKTLGKLRKKLPTLLAACLFKRYSTETKPTYVGFEVKNDDWLVFPWER